MTAKEIYKSTKKFPTRLLLLNILCSAISILLLAVFVGLGMATKSGGLVIGGLLATLVVYRLMRSLLQHWVGYMFKYGSVHAIATAYVTGTVTGDYFNQSVEYIKTGSIKANAYLVLDKMVHRAVKGVTSLVNFITGFLPDNIRSFINIFIDTYLDYVDECCLAWSVLHGDQNAAKSSCDGVVLYYQNGKEMLAPAFKTTLRIFVTYLVIFLIGCLLMFFWPAAIAWWLIAFSVMEPYLKHRVLCNVIVAYLERATQTQLQTDLYEKLSKVSAFRKLRDKIGDPQFEPAPGNDSSVFQAMQNQPEPEMIPNAEIPEPPKIEQQPVSQEKILWQKAWEKMSTQQKQQYKDMDKESRRTWRRQILKALYGFEVEEN